MASIQKRPNKNGGESYRVQIRRKGMKSFSATFSRKKDACSFAEKYEPLYCLDPETFDFDRLKHQREQEFI